MVTGVFALTAFWLALALALAFCSVAAPCPMAWNWPEPPHPARHELPPPTCVAVACCCVFARLTAAAPAALPAVWFAELDPPVTLPPAMVTGTLALTAFWFAFASDFAFCSVAAPCPTAWNWPEPPQPARHELPPPTCVALACWLVLAALTAAATPAFFAVWFAELVPPVTLPPAMVTGTFALTAF